MKPLMAMFASMLLAGCAARPPRSDISASDRGVLVPALRVSKNFGDEPLPPSAAQAGGALELGFSRASGAGTQTLGSGAAPVEYAGSVFAGPQTLQHDFDIGFFDLSLRWRHFFEGGPLGLELLAGLTHADLDLVVSSPGQRAHDSLSSFGGTFGAGLIWRLRPATSLHARIALYGSLDGLLTRDADETANRFELALVQALGRNASVRAGYAYYRFEADRGTASTLNLIWAGPMLGLELHF